MFIPENRIIVIVGHYGSGKSEIAINMALLFSMLNSSEGYQGHKGLDDSPIFLIDLDIVNPYFRSREQKDILESNGIKVIASAEDFPNGDLPYMPESILALFDNPKARGVLDIGGDAAGARVLARYRDRLVGDDIGVYLVINGNRPMSKEVREIKKYISDIQGASGIRITGLINNTHLLGETDKRDVLRGMELAKRVEEETGIPLVANCVRRELAEEFGEEEFDPILPLTIHLKKPWER